MEEGRRLGLVSDRAFHVEHERWERRRRARVSLSEKPLRPDLSTREAVRAATGVEITAPTTWAKLLCRQDVDTEAVAALLPELAALEPADRRIVVGLLRYEGYLVRQEREVARLDRLRDIAIPAAFDPVAIPGLSLEIIEALERGRPKTLADAERLPGMTPAAMAIIAGRIAHREKRR